MEYALPEGSAACLSSSTPTYKDRKGSHAQYKTRIVKFAPYTPVSTGASVCTKKDVGIRVSGLQAMKANSARRGTGVRHFLD